MNDNTHKVLAVLRKRGMTLNAAQEGEVDAVLTDGPGATSDPNLAMAVMEATMVVMEDMPLVEPPRPRTPDWERNQVEWLLSLNMPGAEEAMKG